MIKAAAFGAVGGVVLVATIAWFDIFGFATMLEATPQPTLFLALITAGSATKGAMFNFALALATPGRLSNATNHKPAFLMRTETART